MRALGLRGYPYVASREVDEVDQRAPVRLEPQRVLALGHRAEVDKLSVRGIVQLEIAVTVAVERQDLHSDFARGLGSREGVGVPRPGFLGEWQHGLPGPG